MPYTILLIEDYADTRRVYQAVLERQGFRVLPASTGEEALQIARTNHIDLIVSDLGLPDCDGCEVLEKIKLLRPVQAIALSGLGSETDMERSRKAGFSHHLIKPVALPQLLSAIRSVLAP